MNLRQLRHAVVLAEELHFGRAAVRAHLTQSAFSRSIQALEEHLGLRLFDRDLRSVRITPAGIRLVARAARLLSVSDDLGRELELLRSGDLGEVAIGAGPYSGAEVLPATLGQLHREHPDVRVRLEVNGWEALLESLQQERIDFFVSDLRHVPPEADLIVEPLGFLQVSLFCNANSSLPKRSPNAVSRLRRCRLVSVNIAQSAKDELARRIFRTDDAVLPIAFESDNPVMNREFAIRSGAILLGTHASLRTELEAGVLQELRIKELEALGIAALQTPIALIRLRDRTQTPACDILRRLILVNQGGTGRGPASASA